MSPVYSRDVGTPIADPAVLLFQYDLRAVLMHDGQKGRKHVYSYINHEDAWWKVVGCTVTKVRLDFGWIPTQIGSTNQSRLQVTLETVSSDDSGINVGAGAFFLIYSRSLSEPLKSEWPETLVSVEGWFQMGQWLICWNPWESFLVFFFRRTAITPILPHPGPGHAGPLKSLESRSSPTGPTIPSV